MLKSPSVSTSSVPPVPAFTTVNALIASSSAVDDTLDLAIVIFMTSFAAIDAVKFESYLKSALDAVATVVLPAATATDWSLRV